MKAIFKPLFYLTIISLLCYHSTIGSPYIQTENNKTISTENDTVYVDDDYNSGTPGWGVYCFDTIQHGITAIDAGGVVYVYIGIYYENIVIDKQIELVGADNETISINGQFITDVITVLADSVLISGFRVFNGNGYGIKLNSSSNTVSGNIFSYHYENAIYAYQAGNNTIEDNFFYTESRGIRLYESSFNLIQNNYLEHGGIRIMQGNYNEISNNHITYYYGIEISASIYNSIIDNTIENFVYSSPGISLDHTFFSDISGNLISNCGKGIEFHACDSNKISMNTIAGNSEAGIILPDCMCGGCNHNSIYHNNFVNNGLHAGDNCNNNWDAGYPSGGNFWDNYSGVDDFSGPNQNIPGSDSIGDTPYYIAGGTEEDLYPLMYPFGMPPFADEVYVDDDFDENTPGWGYDHFDCVHDGVNYVNRGGVVKVSNGIYHENIFINKQLTLSGNQKDSVIIDGMGLQKIIYNIADSVSMSGLTIRNGAYYSQAVTFKDAEYCSLTNCEIEECHDGLWCGNANHMKITSVSISDCDGTGLLLGSNSCLISSSSFNNNWLGVWIGGSLYNTFSGNYIIDNYGQGGVSISNADNNYISSNKILNNAGYGIRFYNSSDNNTLKGNRIEGNLEYGIKLFDNSNDNIVYHNIFKDNLPANTYDECNNIWHNGYDLPFNPWFGGGNYYGDYPGVDEFKGPGQNIPGSDGIGDDDYTIPGNSGNYDDYPFMNEYGWHIRLWEEGLAEGGNNAGNLDTLSEYKYAQNINSNYITEDKLSFTVSPNPGKNIIVAKTSSPEYKFDFKLYDLRGNEILYSTNNALNIELNTSLLPAGLYIYIITCENGYQLTGKWIKE